MRVGSRQPIHIDVRLIAATNVDLERAVAAGRFRHDLYYRLNIARLDLPPLRQRVGDILPLATHFLGSYAQRLGRPPPILSPTAQRALMAHPWPGNIRELENVIHFALLVSDDGPILPEHLKFAGGFPAIRPEAELAPIDAIALQLARLFDAPAERLMERLEALIIERAYTHSHFNQVRTAQLLGVTRNVVRTLLKRHGLVDSDRQDAG